MRDGKAIAQTMASNMKVLEPSADIRPSARTVWVTLGVLMAGALSLCFVILRPFLGPIFGGAAMAVVSFPIHQRIRGRVTNPTLAAGFSTVVICLAFVTPFTLMAMSVSKELEHTYNVLRREGLNGGLPRLWQAVGPPLAAIAAWSGMTEGEFREVLTTRLQEAGAFLLHQSLALLGALTGGVG